MGIVQFDTEDLVYAFEVVARVAPTSKGTAWDKAAGMLIEISPDGETHIYATDIESSAHVQTRATHETKPSTPVLRWRMSTLFLANLVTKLGPITKIEYKEGVKSVLFRSGRSKVKVPLMDESKYIDIPEPDSDYPEADATVLTELASSVRWACDTNGTGVLTGLHVDGTNIVGTSHECMSLIPIPADVDTPVTFQTKVISSLTGAASIHMSADTDRIYFWLNETDWISTTLFHDPYPKYGKLRRDEYQGEFKVSRWLLLEALERMNIVMALDRDMPRLDVTLTETMMLLNSSTDEVGDSEEIVDISGGPDEEFKISYSVGMLRDAVNASAEDDLVISWGSEKQPLKSNKVSTRITDGTGWEAYVMPRNPSTGRK